MSGFDDIVENTGVVVEVADVVVEVVDPIAKIVDIAVEVADVVVEVVDVVVEVVDVVVEVVEESSEYLTVDKELQVVGLGPLASRTEKLAFSARYVPPPSRILMVQFADLSGSRNAAPFITQSFRATRGDTVSHRIGHQNS